MRHNNNVARSAMVPVAAAVMTFCLSIDQIVQHGPLSPLGVVQRLRIKMKKGQNKTNVKQSSVCIKTIVALIKNTQILDGERGQRFSLRPPRPVKMGLG